MGTLVCRVELDKEKGVIVTVDNKDGKILQTLILDGTSITSTCKGDQETSTIIQKEDSIAVTCKDFSVNAETIKMNASKDTLHHADGKYTVTSSKDLSFDSSATLCAKASSSMDLAAQSIDLKATGAFSAKGSSTSISADSTASMDGTSLKLNGKAQSEMAAPSIKVSASGILNVEGQLTNIKGSLVKIG